MISTCSKCGGRLNRYGESLVGECVDCGALVSVRARGPHDEDAFDSLAASRAFFNGLLAIGVILLPCTVLAALCGILPFAIAGVIFVAITISTGLLLLFRIAQNAGKMR